MGDIRRLRPARPVRLAGALAIAVGTAMAATGALILVTPPASRSVAPADVGTLPQTSTTQGSPPPNSAAIAPAPVRIRIPGIHLDSALVDLQVQPDGHLAAPAEPDQVGWWSDGPHPGDPGAAIIVGHIDSRTGPAAFYHLSALRPGDSVTIDRADHTRIAFIVQALRQYAKSALPDQDVYTPAGPPALRLITCGGPYDHRAHQYLDNLVVYAALAAPAHARHFLFHDRV
ncbi:class F sortase [Streptacidiphilus neutrinimicus]|uniref:class F sortase n=1 Tax=Streptacidiphilus neutrinimicus TaxID=105420 RepID=UPI0009FE10BE|nr:class F sortase [Streptacidiphilus neutrinimicus]